MLRYALLARELNEKWAVLNLAQLCSLCLLQRRDLSRNILHVAFQKLIMDVRNRFEAAFSN